MGAGESKIINSNGKNISNQFSNATKASIKSPNVEIIYSNSTKSNNKKKKNIKL